MAERGVRIEAENLSFAYGRRPVLEEVSLRVEPGDCCDLSPNLSRKGFSIGLVEPIGGTDGHRQPVVECKEPFRRCIDDADDLRQACRRSNLEVSIED